MPSPRKPEHATNAEEILEHISEGFFSLNEDMVITRFNRAAGELLGRDGAEVIGTAFGDAFPEARGSVFEQRYEHALEHKEPVTFEAYFGEYPYTGWYDVHVHPHPGGISVFFQVTTERKKADERLRRVLENAESQKHNLQELLTATRAVIEHQGDFAAAAGILHAACKRVIGANAGYIALLSETGDENDVVYLDPGEMTCTVDPRLPMPIRGFREKAYREGRAQYHNEFGTSEYMKLLPEGHVGLHNVLFAPLICEQQVVGLLGLGNKEGGFDDADARLAEAFADLAALALRNTRSVEKLSQSEERFRLIVESTSDIVFTLDTELKHSGVFGDWPPKYGLSPDDFLGRTSTEIMGPEAGAVHEAHARTALQGERVTYEWSTPNPRGGTAWVQTSLAPLRGNAGEVIGVIGVGRDITAVKNAELAEARRVEELKRYLDVAGVVFLILDPQGRVQLLNTKGRRILGVEDLPDSQIIGADWFERFVPEEERDERRELFKRFRVSEADDIVAHEDHVMTANGEIRTIAWRNSILREDGPGFSGVLCSGADVTEARRVEEGMREAQRLEAVGRLAGGIAHDFNNILTTIIGVADMAQMDDDQSREELSEALQEILDASQRASDLTRQLLAFSRKQILKPELIDVNAKVHDLEGMLRRLIGEDIDLKVTTHPKAGTVRVDSSRLEQVIMNLAVNARDAMPDGGKLTIETRAVFLDQDYSREHPEVSPGDYVMIAVSDSGTGMDESTRSRIFEPFYTTKEPGKGTGLGLSTVFGVVRQSGGHIFVYSELGRGTTFRIYFPRQRMPVVAGSHEVPAPPVQEGTERILVVEDDERVRKVVVRILQSAGYSVVATNTCAQAVETVRTEQADGGFDLLLTDVIMPEMNGRELADRIARISPGIRTLFTSGYTDNAIVHHGVLEDGVAFIEKPYEPSQLLNKIRDVLANP